MTAVATPAFLETLHRVPLLEPGRLEELTRDLLPRFPEPGPLAWELLRRAWLTPYQADQLLLGHGEGLLLGPYVVLERLGKGAMGQVFKARHRVLGRLVAVKVLHEDLLDDVVAVRRFEREARALMRLRHPNIVRAWDAGRSGGTHFLALEYVEGTDLRRLVERSGPLAVDRACEYVRQAALGLQHAHEHGIVHRDVKPANLLLGANGVVKLLDLGLSRPRSGSSDGTTNPLTARGAILGTLDYLAPEQAVDASRVDVRADLYSLGCTLYHLLAGQPPFASAGPLVKLFKHQREEPAPVERVRPETPPAVAAVVRKLMAKRPEDRYQTPADVATALAAPDLLRGGHAAADATPAPVAPRRMGCAVDETTLDWSAPPAATAEEAAACSGPVRQP